MTDLSKALDACVRALIAPETPETVGRGHFTHLSQSLLPGVAAVADVIEAQVRAEVAREIRNLAEQVAKSQAVRPLRGDALVSTDFASDFEWAALVVENSGVI